MISRQMELHFEAQQGLMPLRRSYDRSSRARWWFEKMRGVVDHARDWPPATPPFKVDRSLAPQATPVAPSPEVGRPGRTWTSPARKAEFAATPGGYRWQFGHTRRLVWE